MAHLIDGPTTNGGVDAAKARQLALEGEARRFEELAWIAARRGEAPLAQSYGDQAVTLKAAAMRARGAALHGSLLRTVGGDRARLRRGLDALEVELERKLEKRTRRGA